MLDYLRNLRKPSEEKQREALNAYLDGALTPQQRQQVEQALAADPELQGELDQLRTMQQLMRRLPQRRVPSNFTLDPALYGRPRREPLVQAYPVLRTATVLTAFIFIFFVAANIFLGGVSNMDTESAEPLAMMVESAAEMAVEEETESVSVEEIAEAEILPQMTAEALPEEESAPVQEAEQPIEEESAGEQEMPAEAQMAPDLDDDGAFIVPQATPVAADQIRKASPTASETRAASTLQPAPTNPPTALATEIATLAEPPIESAQLPVDEVEEQARPLEAPGPTFSSSFGGLSLIIILLGVVLVILLLLTLIARRRLRE